MNNPYWGKNILEFFLLFFERLGSLLFGSLNFADLASDEIQILVLSFVAIASALVGTFLVLRKMTMLANALSHTILLGIVIAYLLLFSFLPREALSAHAMSLQLLFLASLATALITTLLTQCLTALFHLKEDASTGLVFTTLFALGIVLITAFTRDAHIGTEAIMGNVDALHLDDLKIVFWTALADFSLILLLFKEWKVTTFDNGFAHSIGFSTSLFNYLLMVLTAATAIASFRAVGVLLVLSFLVTPILIARLFCQRLKYLIFLSVGVGVFISFLSVALSRHLLTTHNLALSTSALTVTLLGLFYFLALCFRFPKKLKRDDFGAAS
jgi:manganese/zinc/iron transport system permease protein